MKTRRRAGKARRPQPQPEDWLAALRRFWSGRVDALERRLARMDRAEKKEKPER